jgi:hypothetical protein
VSVRGVADSCEARATIDHLEAALDLALELTFPASDPVSVCAAQVAATAS